MFLNIYLSIKLSAPKIVINYVVGILLVLVLVWAYKMDKKEKLLLESDNQITTGIVIKTINRKRGFDFQFKYWVRGRKYTNWEKIYGNTVNVGDSVNVIYYTKNPNISNPTLLNKN